MHPLEETIRHLVGQIRADHHLIIQYIQRIQAGEEGLREKRIRMEEANEVRLAIVRGLKKLEA